MDNCPDEAIFSHLNATAVWYSQHKHTIHVCSKVRRSLLSRQVGKYWIQVWERSCSCHSLHASSWIRSPYPTSSILLFEPDTGAVQGIHTNNYQRWWLQLTQSEATAIIQRETLADFRLLAIYTAISFLCTLHSHFWTLYEYFCIFSV